MRTDSQIQQDAIDELKLDPLLGSAEIGVAARGGVVTLSGALGSDVAKARAILLVEGVPGVKAVADEIAVLQPGHRPTDTELAHAILNALNWDYEVPSEAIVAHVDEGWVWLDGEVHWAYQRIAAERAVRRVSGVVGVTNGLRLKARQVIRKA
jgi:osmotically-inducible protein OsmY